MVSFVLGKESWKVRGGMDLGSHVGFVEDLGDTHWSGHVSIWGT